MMNMEAELINDVKVVYEDNHLIGVYKPSGILVQGDRTGDISLIDWVKNYIKFQYQKKGEVFLGLIHRIDRPVSGLVLMAKTSKGLTRMNELFRERKIEKKYLTIVDGKRCKDGKLEHFLEKHPLKNKTKIVRKKTAEAKLSTLNFKTKKEVDPFYLLEVQPHTGRPHQIRVQLAKEVGHIINDIKYGYKDRIDNEHMIYLHSHSLSFIHPVKKEKITISCPPPEEGMWNLFV